MENADDRVNNLRAAHFVTDILLQGTGPSFLHVILTSVVLPTKIKSTFHDKINQTDECIYSSFSFLSLLLLSQCTLTLVHFASKLQPFGWGRLKKLSDVSLKLTRRLWSSWSGCVIYHRHMPSFLPPGNLSLTSFFFNLLPFGFWLLVAQSSCCLTLLLNYCVEVNLVTDQATVSLAPPSLWCTAKD